MMMIVIFDTETTGLTLHPDADLDRQPRIIEIGAVLMSAEDGTVVDELSRLVNPGMPLDEAITKITGLTDADLADAPSWAETLPFVSEFFARAALVVAHNLPFDRAMIFNEHARLRRAGLMVPDFPWPAAELCTVSAFAEEWGRGPRLLELYEDVFGRPLAQTHRALDDVKALAEIVRETELWKDAKP